MYRVKQSVTELFPSFVSRNNKQSFGFTIVELLIVIVVIGILAVITIISYNGVQNRANDAVIQGDLDNIGKQLNIFYAAKGVYPTTSSDILGLNIKPSKGSYSTNLIGTDGVTAYNLIYCYSPSTSPTTMGLFAMSKSGNSFMYTSSGVSAYPTTVTVMQSTTICSNVGIDITNGVGNKIYFYNNGWSSSFVAS